MASSKKPLSAELTPKFFEQLLTFRRETRGLNPAGYTEFEGSCGTNIVSGLHGNNVAQQLKSLVNAFEIDPPEPEYEYDDDDNETLLEGTDNYHHRTQVVLSDTVNTYNTKWNATKSVSYHGPVSNNPNSGNDIQLYILTLDCLPELVKLLPKNLQDRYFSDKPVKAVKKKEMSHYSHY